MAYDELNPVFDTAHARAILDTLWVQWPAFHTLRPALVDVDDALAPEFLHAVQHLSDLGLISYEALIVGPTGPVVLDATLTARGRAICARQHGAEHEPARQLAG
ncbi:hypothetical protein AB2M62_10395 [Sphingomonas sp. MMS12-HWE2-04]|uniref:hypothetical protein n=1 Tax=Sphingomonas sp. MMS12-HWE2-04 TaxID=3234199 RepID=UPI0038512317